MTTLHIVLLIIFALCILSSGFLSGSETAIVAVPRERAHQLAQRGKRGQRLELLLADLEGTIGTLLLANNFVNILAASVATTLAIDLVGESWGPWLSTVAVTAIILVVGEITPKTLAARRPDQYALTVAGALWRLTKALQPVARLFVALSRAILRVLGVHAAHASTLVTEEDIRSMAILGEEAGEIEEAEREIIDSLFSLADRPVRDVMTPRVDVVALEHPVTPEQVRLAVANTGHSRYPVIAPDADLDQMLGVLYFKDLYRVQDPYGSEQIRRLLREPLYVPESTPVLTALHQMRLRRAGFAAILDEHGGVEGILTIKDLVSELVGELQDEYDPGTPVTVAVESNVWITDGRIPVEELAETLGTEFPVGPYATAGGMFLSIAGDIPTEGDSAEVAGYRMTVLEMDRRRIDRLRIEPVE
ncbi:MAG: hemolysin family protein [Acidimicrobiia bacterium]|nr:hemolysin family protein [Acidimicrobiia bacterium]MDH3397197.1 hemolysin family protein [Acidimicrobiia bacterium]